jgi:hypothetical protein
MKKLTPDELARKLAAIRAYPTRIDTDKMLATRLIMQALEENGFTEAALYFETIIRS